MQWISVLNFTEDGRLYILDKNIPTNIHNLTVKDPGSKESFYHMARIDADGGFKLYSHPKKENPTKNDEEARNDMKRLERLVIVAIWCIQEDPSLRPSMKKVTQVLEVVIEVSVPPSPSLFTSSPPSFKK
ncbi:g-type lectin s-receptor-like serine/threonine-protein kinase rlk1 [Quercus suber]|uniref:G-type lectin s-receptor-like serine/threonine-protein kinase rlk1 n=1 Tax=Quercus suber TaxID=58331 RepID=A0AAW0KVY8_QUESU